MELTTDPVGDIVSFNLVIERLLISGHRLHSHREALSSGFNLVIERLLISGEVHGPTQSARQSSFQSRYRAASHFRE